MRHFTMVASGFAVAAAGSAASADMNTAQFRGGLTAGTVQSGSIDRTGTSIIYSSLGVASPFDNFSGYGFTHGTVPTFDDILTNAAAGTRIDELSFSAVSFNSDGTTGGDVPGGTTTATAQIALFNEFIDPTGNPAPDFNSPKAIITVTGLEIDSFTVNVFTLDVKDLNIINKDERFWAGLSWVSATGPANADGTPLLDGLGQGIFNAATKGFSEDFFWDPDGLSFFGGADAGNPYANFGWEFRAVPTPGAMAIFGLAGLAATRRRR